MFFFLLKIKNPKNIWDFFYFWAIIKMTLNYLYIIKNNKSNET